MIVLSNFFMALAQVIDIALSGYVWIVIARAVVSWISLDPYHPVIRFLVQVTEPALGRIRRVVPVMGGIDLSPMILILGIIFLQSFLVPTLQQFALNLR